MNDEKKSWLDRAGAIHLWKTIEAMLGTKVDKIEGFGLSSNDYTTEEKKKLASLSDPNVATTENNGLMSSADKAKLDGIEAGANNYTHPKYEAKQAGLYRISVDNTGHVATADKMTSEELAAEGVSPADHTHDLGELVDTLETSADAVEDADTVMVGATVTSDDGNATTKYTRRPLATLWNWIKAKADTLYAAVGHNHKVNELENYDTHVYNPTLNRTKRTVLAAPTATDGPATFRALDKNDVGLGNVDNVAALPLTGGTISGALNFANNTWNLVGDDAYMGDHNIGGSFCIIGANNTTGLALVNKDNQGDYALIRYGGGNLNFNKKLEANITGHADGDLSLGGGTMSGSIKRTSGGTQISARDRTGLYSGYPGDWSYGSVVGQCTKNGVQTIGCLGGQESLVFSYSLDSDYNSGNNSTTQVTLDARGGTIALTSDIQQGVVAYGSNYVRFGDGTQICWGSCGNNSFSSFGAAFANTDYRIGMSEWKSSSWENYAIGSKSTTGVTLRSEDNTMEYIAIGRWK